MPRRFLLALAVSLALTGAARAVDLPTGKWTVNLAGSKGEMVITEVAKDGTVKARHFGADLTGTWKNGVLTLNDTAATLEARLVSEPVEKEKGKIKYTLTGTYTQVSFFEVDPPANGKFGWYAQIVADAPPPPVPLGTIKAEIRGVLVQDGTNVYVSVKHKSGSGVEETRVWVWKSEGEWKVLQHTLAPLYGKEVIVTGQLAQLPKGHMTSIPEGAMYFLGKFDIKLAK